MKTLNSIELKFMGATNSRGDRIRMTQTRFNQSVTRIIPWDYAKSHMVDIAADYLISIGFDANQFVGSTQTKNGFVILTTEFKFIDDSAEEL